MTSKHNQHKMLKLREVIAQSTSPNSLLFRTYSTNFLPEFYLVAEVGGEERNRFLAILHESLLYLYLFEISFLGFGNFYQKFISHYLDLAKPLTNLTKKDRKFKWTEGCQQAFDKLKKQFMEEPVLLMPDHNQPFQIESDASKVATGAVLTQLDSNGDRHPVAFLSQTFTDTERRYKIYDRELLGII